MPSSPQLVDLLIDREGRNLPSVQKLPGFDLHSVYRLVVAEQVGKGDNAGQGRAWLLSSSGWVKADGIGDEVGSATYSSFS